jgi:UDP-N-acetylmuramate dehydrogenase
MNSLAGGEFLLGIPGSIGGALKMNAGAYGYEIGNNVSEINCYDLDQQKIIKLKSEKINYSYRSSKNLDNKVILSAILKFEKGDSKKISEKMSEFNKIRKKNQPPAIYNAGSVFKNSSDYFAGELIENAGLKGYAINNVSVSYKHANFFIAKKGAKASSLYNLVQYVKEKVNDKYGVMLEEEIQFIGEFG